MGPLLVGVVVGMMMIQAIPAGAQTSGSATVTAGNVSTTTTVPLTLAQWKAQYEPAVGQIADDALIVFDTGMKNARHPTKKTVQATISACRKWQNDARTLPGTVPHVPLASAEKMWKSLVSASISASSACTGALTRGSRSAAKYFRKQLTIVGADERRLVNELNNSKT